MLRFLLTPRWIALHVAIAAALVVFVVLGWWQLGVYRESQGRQDLRALEPAPLAELARPGEPLGDARDRQVIVEGRYLADQQLLVPGRIRDNVLGTYVLTPLRTDDGVIVPVLRGWVDALGTLNQPTEPASRADLAEPTSQAAPNDPTEPTDSTDPADAAFDVPEGVVSAAGFLLPPETAGHATVRSDRPLDDGQLAYIAPDQLEQRAGLPVAEMIEGYLLLQHETPEPAAAPATLDVGSVAPIRDVSPWQNLSYWAQWWVFAAAALIFWFSVVRAGLRSRRGEVSEPARSRVPS